MFLHYNIEFQRTHNLVYLLDLLSQKIEISDEIYDKAIVQNKFSIQIRYPDITLFLSKQELGLSIKLSVKFRTFAINIMGIVE